MGRRIGIRFRGAACEAPKVYVEFLCADCRRGDLGHAFHCARPTWQRPNGGVAPDYL
jgi:hypothetical protein